MISSDQTASRGHGGGTRKRITVTLEGEVYRGLARMARTGGCPHVSGAAAILISAAVSVYLDNSAAPDPAAATDIGGEVRRMFDELADEVRPDQGYHIRMRDGQG